MNVLVIIRWVYYAYIFIFLRATMTGSLAASALLLIMFHFFYLLQTYTYFKVIFTQPGSPPRSLLGGYNMNDKSNDNRSNENTMDGGRSTDREMIDTEVYSYDQVTMVTAKRNGQPRMCRKCDNLKPDRTHHCSICGECILKFDHHCPWYVLDLLGIVVRIHFLTTVCLFLG